MFDRATTVTSVTNWPSIGINPPKALADKLAVFDAVRYVETAHVVQIDTSAITTTNADDAVAELAAKLLPTESEPGQRSALDRAKAAILDRLGREILSLASDAVPGIVEQLQPAFDQAVSVFTESVADLPEPLTSEALVHAGPGALSQYQAAREASQTITAIDSWLAELVNLPAYAGLKTSPATRVLSPANRGELAKLRTAHDRRNADPLENELGRLFLAAAREGIEFNLNTPAESEQLRQNIESALPMRT